MQFDLFKKMVLWAVALCVLLGNTAVTLALQAGEVVPNEGKNASIKLGETVSNLNELYNANWVNEKIRFNNKPTLLVVINGFVDVDKLLAIQNFYEQNKDAMDLYVITHMTKQQMDYFVGRYSIRMPYYFTPSQEFIWKINSSSPALIIIDQNLRVRYNGEYNIDVKDLAEYMKKLISGETSKEPHFTYLPIKTPSVVPAPQYKQRPQPILKKIGESMVEADFQGVDGEPIHFETGKPTVLLFFLSITLSEQFEAKLPLLDSLVRKRGNDANIYLVFGGCDNYFINEVTTKYQYSMPALRTDYHLNYSRRFPAIVIFDAQGILRYRDVKINDVEGILYKLNAQQKVVSK